MASLMSLHAGDPQFRPQADTDLVCVTPLVAAIYLDTTLAFAIYRMGQPSQPRSRSEASLITAPAV